ncbi:hypothetical protein PINS_up014390 [Pythium insidiosum]|nr:hypothetical protein PINS_up014390 [Pythium insidiosum]
MFYDPMISKLITYGKDRPEALERMKSALDHYVIRGPGNNISFLQDVYRHPRFVSGKITTKFIAEEYPEGFDGVRLTATEQDELTVVGAVMHLQKAAASRLTDDTKSSASLQIDLSAVNEDELELVTAVNGLAPRFRVLSEAATQEELIALASRNALERVGEKLFVSTDGAFGETREVSVVQLDVEKKRNRVESSFLAFVDGKWHVVSDVDWQLNAPLFRASYVRAGFEKNLASQVVTVLPEGYRMQHHGAVQDVIVRNALEQKYSAHMLPKPEIDTSNLLLCPMPGMLVSVAVQEGDHVEIGQELCVVEAMKMQNVLRAEKKGVVKAVKHQPGAALKVDEIILEYE